MPRPNRGTKIPHRLTFPRLEQARVPKSTPKPPDIQTPQQPELPALRKPTNPLLDDAGPPAVDLTDFDSPNIFRRPSRPSGKRILRDQRRIESAAQAIAGFDRDVEIYGFTKGAFSVIDLLRAALDYTGPAHLVISTWTAANTDVSTVLDFVDSGTIASAKWLVDLTFTRRSPQLAHRIRQTFGRDAIRVAKNHAKFALLATDDPDPWKVVIHTSMNLNFNPRFENFSIEHSPALWKFHHDIIEEIWRRQKATFDAEANPYAIHKHFDADL